jgi:general secretion pathway protein G
VSRQAGFSLIELMVTIVIIGLLSTIVLINVLPSRDKAMVEKARTDIAILEQAIESFRLDMFTYPTTAQGLEALVTAPGDLRRPELYREGGYIRRLPDDPWGQPYVYAAPGRSGAFEIRSLGADGLEGGSGLDADIGPAGSSD